MARQYTASIALVALLLFGSATAFYLPGVAPQDFAKESQNFISLPSWLQVISH
jgi:hypothetical protein